MRALFRGMVALVAIAAHSLAGEPVTFKNPVYRQNMPDPCVIEHEGYYYAYGTTGDRPLADGRAFRVLRSSDLVHWDELGGALQPLPSDKPLQYWAPEVAEHDGKFYLYYSVGTLDDLQFKIRVAISDRPEGPYIDNGKPLEDGEGAKFFIDGHPYQDNDGQWYFFYAKDFVNDDDGNHFGTGIVVDRLVDMARLEGKPRVVVRPRFAWTLFEAKRAMPMYTTEKLDWHTIEAPWVVKREGKYYCMYSGSNFGTDNYGVDFVVADSVMGSYTGQGDHARVLKGVRGKVAGPGHHSVVRLPDGRGDVIVYHAWNADKSARQLCIDRLQWTAEGPKCAGPTADEQSIDAAIEP